MQLWRDFRLVLEEQHLIVKKGLLYIVKLRVRYRLYQINPIDFSAKIGREGACLNMLIAVLPDCDHRVASSIGGIAMPLSFTLITISGIQIADKRL